jgi:hypothetical protein
MATGLESPAFLEAVNDHQYYLGLQRNTGVSREEAEIDFIVNYLIPWVETRPPVDFDKRDKGNLHHSCTHIREFNYTQIDALKKAISDDRWYLSQNNDCEVDEETAKQDFLRKHLQRWAILFRTGYCLHICEDRKNCNIARTYAEKAEISLH